MCVMTVQGGVFEMSHTRVKQNANSAAIWVFLSVFDPVAVLRNAFAHAMSVLCQWMCTLTLQKFCHFHTHTRASHSVSEVTASTVAAEFLVLMWVVLLYLARPVNLGPMKDDLLPRMRMPGWSSLLLLTSLPGSWSSSSSLLFFCSP